MEWIQNYKPRDRKEEKDRDHLLKLPSTFVGTSRDCPYHFTNSSIVIDVEQEKLLMIYHPIYESLSWPGGHIEEGENLFESALRELYEETGLEYVQPLSQDPIGMEILPVKKHQRKGESVEIHFHVNFTFGFMGKVRDTIFHNESGKVHWIPLDSLDTFVNEAHMLPIYKKYMERFQKIKEEEKNK